MTSIVWGAETTISLFGQIPFMGTVIVGVWEVSKLLSGYQKLEPDSLLDTVTDTSSTIAGTLADIFSLLNIFETVAENLSGYDAITGTISTVSSLNNPMPYAIDNILSSEYRMEMIAPTHAQLKDKYSLGYAMISYRVYWQDVFFTFGRPTNLKINDAFNNSVLHAFGIYNKTGSTENAWEAFNTSISNWWK